MATTMRKCGGSKTFAIEAHEAPPANFPAQPSRKDGLGTMCKPHWNQYTSALRKAALARKALEADQEARAAKGSVIDRLTRAANAAGGTVTTKPVSACSKTVSKRTCVAGAEGHAGPHDWPKAATAALPEVAKLVAPRPKVDVPAAIAREVAKERKAATKAESPRARKARAVVAATESLGGKTYTDAVGSDEVQAALEGGGQEDTFESDVRAILT